MEAANWCSGGECGEGEIKKFWNGPLCFEWEVNQAVSNWNMERDGQMMLGLTTVLGSTDRGNKSLREHELRDYHRDTVF